MIVGLGSDLVDILRIEKTLNRFGTRFTERCFTPAEREKAESRRAGGLHVATYARRFAAKEACVKALGTGIAGGIFFRDIEILSEASGKPVLQLHKAAELRLQSLIPPGLRPALHLTMTDDHSMAFALVIIEAV